MKTAGHVFTTWGYLYFNKQLVYRGRSTSSLWELALVKIVWPTSLSKFILGVILPVPTEGRIPFIVCMTLMSLHWITLSLNEILTMFL